MNDYLNSLVTRTLRLAPVVQPRPASLFEPIASAGPVSEPALIVHETQQTASTNATAELPDVTDRRVPRNEQVPLERRHAIAQPLVTAAAGLPAQVASPSPFAVNASDSTRELGDQRPRSVETESTTRATEVRHDPTRSFIKPEVRIFSPAADRDAEQPPSTTPPMTTVVSHATRSADAFQQSGKLSAQAADSAETPETVVVTIGRVDVRAIFAPPQPASRPTRTQPQPLSLDEYLKQRSEGRR